MEQIDYKPAEQRIMVLPEENKERKTASGIIIPGTADDKRPEMGIIVRAGKGDIDNPMAYSVGERVMYSQYSGLEVKLDLVNSGEHVFKVMNQMDVMGTIAKVNKP